MVRIRPTIADHDKVCVAVFLANEVGDCLCQTIGVLSRSGIRREESKNINGWIAALTIGCSRVANDALPKCLDLSGLKLTP